MEEDTRLHPHVIASEVKARARALGFDLVGIAPAEPSQRAAFFRQWLAEGKHGQMGWLERRIEERLDPGVYLPGARTVICVAVNYHAPLTAEDPGPGVMPGRVARYALGDDYHDWMKPRLHELADWLRQRVAGTQTRCAVDTAPVMEKELAARAGVGWVGKNTCIINERAGSWLLLGEVLTTADLPVDNPAVDRCGTCRRCIEACPTQALEPYQIDARRCISYLTIELRTDVPPELRPGIGNWLFGCDICQDVCPWNHAALETCADAFQPRWPSGTLDATTVAGWTAADYQRELKGSAMKRVKLDVLNRNAGTVLANAGTK